MNAWLNENPQLSDEFTKSGEVAQFLWARGWAEANGGNLSINVTPLIARWPEEAAYGPRVMLGRAYPALAGQAFLVSGTGRRFRDFARDIGHNGCILRVEEGGKSYRLIWGGESRPDFRPTSELPTHLTLHEILWGQGLTNSVVLHTHPTELVALSHLADYKEEASLNEALWGTLPEVKVLIPRGLAFVPYAVPGSEELAATTGAALKRGMRVILWEMHGCLAAASDVAMAFDLIDTANKAAQIQLLCLSAGEKPRGLGKRRVAELVQAFKLED